MTIVEALVMDQRTHRLLGRHVRKSLDVFRGAAEPGTFEQMRGALKGPVGSADRREITNPLKRPSAAAGRFVRQHQRHGSDEGHEGESAPQTVVEPWDGHGVPPPWHVMVLDDSAGVALLALSPLSFISASAASPGARGGAGLPGGNRAARHYRRPS